MRKMIGIVIMFVGIFLFIPYIPVLIMDDGNYLFFMHRFGFNLILPAGLPTFLEFLIGSVLIILGWWIAFRRNL